MILRLCKLANELAGQQHALGESAWRIGRDHGWDSDLYLIANRLAGNKAKEWWSVRRRISAINSRTDRRNQRATGRRGKRRVVQ